MSQQDKMSSNDCTTNLCNNESSTSKTKKRRRLDDYLKLRSNTDEYMNRVYIESKLDKVRMHAQSVFFAGMYDDSRIKMRFVVALFCGIIYAIVIFFLVDTTGLYSSGTSGLFQGLARVISTALSVHGVNEKIVDDVYQGLFWSIWFTSNIPLMLFAWFKVGKRFTLLTLTFVLTATVSGLLLSTSIFVDPKNAYAYFFLGDPLTLSSRLINNHVFVLSWNYFPTGSFIYNLPANSALNGGVNSSSQLTTLSNSDWEKIMQLRTSCGYEDLPRVVSLLGYTAILSIVYPIILSVIYIIGGSSGGTDIPSIYWSDKKKIQLGKTLTIFNSCTMIVGILLGSYISSGIVDSRYWGAEYFFSPNLILSIVYSVIGYICVNIYYPRFKQSVLKIYSNVPEVIIKKMQELKYPYQLNVYKSVQIVSDKQFETSVLETIVRYIELPKIIYEIRSVDNDAFLTINMLRGIDGNLLINRGRD